MCRTNRSVDPLPLRPPSIGGKGKFGHFPRRRRANDVDCFRRVGRVKDVEGPFGFPVAERQGYTRMNSDR